MTDSEKLQQVKEKLASYTAEVCGCGRPRDHMAEVEELVRILSSLGMVAKSDDQCLPMGRPRTLTDAQLMMKQSGFARIIDFTKEKSHES